VGFKDLTPLLADPEAYGAVVDWMAEEIAPLEPDKVAGVEARGFLFAAPLALRLGVGLIPVRKAGKLPWEVEAEQYSLEYGDDLLEVHRDAVEPGERVAVVDDVLATGGTARAGAVLVERLGGKVAAVVFAVELAVLGGRGRLGEWDTRSLVVYS
jgi:adenine phosphoribosyltransferase